MMTDMYNSESSGEAVSAVGKFAKMYKKISEWLMK